MKAARLHLRFILLLTVGVVLKCPKSQGEPGTTCRDSLPPSAFQCSEKDLTARSSITVAGYEI